MKKYPVGTVSVYSNSQNEPYYLKIVGEKSDSVYQVESIFYWANTLYINYMGTDEMGKKYFTYDFDNESEKDLIRYVFTLKIEIKE